MSTILQQERDTYADAWALPTYAHHAPGEHYAEVFAQLAGPLDGKSVLDAGAGCGKGALALAANGCELTLFDLVDDGLVSAARSLPFVSGVLWQLDAHVAPASFDFVYCTDVLEHVPPQFTMLVIDQMLRVAREGLFMSVSTVQDSFGVWVGKPLHQTVRPFIWWRDSLRELGRVVEARDMITNATFWVTPRAR